MRARFATERMADELEAVYRRALLDEGPPRPQAHRRQRLREPPARAAAGAARSAGIDARFLGLDVPGIDAPRFYERLDELDVPYRRVRCGLDVSPRMARDVIRAVRLERPTSCTRTSSTPTSTARSRPRVLRVPYVSTRHNDDRYLLGPFRFVDRAFARPARRLIAISDAVRRFLERAGHAPEKLVTVRYGLDAACRPRPRSVTPDAAGIPRRRPAAPRRRPPDRAEGSPDAAARVRPRSRATPGCAARDPRQRAAGRATRALVRELGLDDAVVLPGRQEPGDWLARADVFVHTSRWEGFGIVLLEAMLARFRSWRRASARCRRSWSTARRASSSGQGTSRRLRAALDDLLADPERARRLGAAGLERARKRVLGRADGRADDRRLPRR